MTAIFSVQRFLLALAVLVVAWAPAATLARPGAQRAAFVSEATAQATEATETRSGTTAQGDSLAKQAI
jgi:hypothetical protein